MLEGQRKKNLARHGHLCTDAELPEWLDGRRTADGIEGVHYKHGIEGVHYKRVRSLSQRQAEEQRQRALRTGEDIGHDAGLG